MSPSTDRSRLPSIHRLGVSEPQGGRREYRCTLINARGFAARIWVGGNWFGGKGSWTRLASACFTVEAAAFLAMASQDALDRAHAWSVSVPLEEHSANGCGAHACPGGAEPFQQPSQRNDFVDCSPGRLSAEMVRSAAAVSQAIPSFCVVAPQPLREPGAVAAQAFADLRASATTEVPSDCLVASAQFIALYLEGSWRHDESEWQDRRQLKKAQKCSPRRA
jgi:hypothetical protein